MSESAVGGSNVGAILDAYLRALESGDAPPREQLLEQHPECAADLAAALDGLEFIHRAVFELPRTPTAGGGLGDRQLLGDFRLVREVGRGGMAVVYEAEQVSLGRRVALKVLPFAAVLDQTQLQRFKNEALAAAHLHHPHIVPVFAVGCERGVHYYAMQLIEGQSLAAVIRDMNGQAQAPASEPKTPITSHGSNRAPGYVRMAAAIGMQAAEALDHAHQLGIVHRDVKPGNLLVDGTGELWVTDFGLARSVRDGDLTKTGELLGTYRYMSPEQTRAKRAPMDHRTDVYSLGATLYELFTLQPAFPGDDPHAVLQEIAVHEPVAPRRLNPALPHDLETIVIKAMCKEPAGRYATAQEMAEDLRRFLENRPVLARRPSLLTRGASWSRRHRAVVAAAFLVLLLAVAALVVDNLRVSREQARTKGAFDKAELNLRLARDAVDRFLAHTGIDEVEQFGLVLDQPGVKFRPRLPPAGTRELLQGALDFYTTFVAEHEDGEGQVTRSFLLAALQRHDEALAAAERALVLDPDLSLAHFARGGALQFMGRWQEALPSFDRAIELAPDGGRIRAQRAGVLYQLGREEEAFEGWNHALSIDPDIAMANNGRGVCLLRRRSFEEALAALTRAVKSAPEFIPAHLNRSIALAELGRFSEALDAIDRALARDPDQAWAHLHRSAVLHQLGRRDDAMAAIDRAIFLDPELGRARYNRSVQLMEAGHREEALVELDRAIELEPTYAPAHDNRSILLLQMGRAEEGLASSERAIAADPQFARAHYNRGTALAELGRLEEARVALARAVELDPKCLEAQVNLGAVLGRLGRPEEALAAYDRAVDLAPDLALAHHNRGITLYELHRFDETLVALDRAIELDANDGSTHHDRGIILDQLDRPNDAIAAYEHAIDLGYRPPDLLNKIAWIRACSPDPALRDADRAAELASLAVTAAPKDAGSRNTLGVALCRTGKWQDALDALHQSVELSNGGSAYDWFFVAVAQWHLDRKDEAHASYEKAVAWTTANQKQDDEELKRFRDEAAGVLGVR